MDGQEERKPDDKSNIYPKLCQNSKYVDEDLNNDGMLLITKAADFSARRHRHQKRKDELTPYINHPIGVAYLLTRLFVQLNFKQNIWN
jgi:(p)ppGpp synthase/HD superfamily hydrolase